MASLDPTPDVERRARVEDTALPPMRVGTVKLVPMVGEAEKEGAPALAVKIVFAPPWAVTAMAEVVFPYKTPLLVNVVAPVPPFPTGNVPDTSAVRDTAEKLGLVPPCKSWVAVPAVVWARTPEALVYKGPPFELNPEKVMVPEDVMPVAATTAPEELT